MHFLQRKRSLLLVALLVLAGGMLVAQWIPFKKPVGSVMSPLPPSVPHVPVFGPLTKAQMAQETQMINKIKLRTHLIGQYKKALVKKRALEHGLLGQVGGKTYDGPDSLPQALHRVKESRDNYTNHIKEVALLKAGLTSISTQDARYARYHRWLALHEKGQKSAAIAISYWSAERERRAPSQAHLQSLAGKVTQIDHRIKELNINLTQMHRTMIYKSLSYIEMPELIVHDKSPLQAITWPTVDKALKLSLRYLKPNHQKYVAITGLDKQLPVKTEGAKITPFDMTSLSFNNLPVRDITGAETTLSYAMTDAIYNRDKIIESVKNAIKEGASYFMAFKLAALNAGYQDFSYWSSNRLAHKTIMSVQPRLLILTNKEANLMPRAQIEELLANGIDFFVLRLNAPILTTQPQETKPTENEKNHLKGLALLAKGQGAKALPWLQKAMDAQDSKIYRFDFARALLELHQYNKAESLFLSIIKNNPWDAQALLFRAIALQGMGDKNRSLADLTSAAYLAPHNEAIQEIYHYERSNMKKEKGSYILPTALKTFVAPDQKALVYLMLPKGLHVIRGKSSWGGWCALRSDVHFLGYIPEEAAGN